MRMRHAAHWSKMKNIHSYFLEFSLKSLCQKVSNCIQKFNFSNLNFVHRWDISDIVRITDWSKKKKKERSALFKANCLKLHFWFKKRTCILKNIMPVFSMLFWCGGSFKWISVDTLICDKGKKRLRRKNVELRRTPKRWRCRFTRNMMRVDDNTCNMARISFFKVLSVSTLASLQIKENLRLEYPK